MLSNLWGAQSNICIHFTLLLCFLVLGQGALSLATATTGNHSAQGNSETESEHQHCGLKNHNQDTQQPSLKGHSVSSYLFCKPPILPKRR